MARRRAIIRAVLGGVAAFALALGGATTAMAEPDPAGQEGTVSGVVTRADDGSPVAGVTVSADGPTWASDITDSAGAYSLQGLPAGSYIVGFSAENSDLKREYWKDSFDYAQATPVVVGAGEAVVGIDATLDEGGAIEGTVTREDDGSTIGFAEVQALDARDEIVGHAQADASGAYRLGGLPAGSYRVRFGAPDPELIPEFWENAYDRDSATWVTVVEKETRTGIDAALTVAGYISGTVTRGADGAPLFAMVSLYDAVELNDMPTAYTAFDGTYRAAVAPGTYKVAFRSTGLAEEYWEDAAIWETATTITVVAGQEVAGIDAALEPIGVISGTVALDSTAVADIRVEAWSGGINVRTIGADRETGAYSLGLADGTYTLKARVEFADGTTTAAPQWFDGVPTEAEATPVQLAPGQTVSGVDFTLVVDTTEPEPEPKPALSLTASSVRAGGDIAISGTGFAAGETVAFELHSDPIALGSLTADQSGRLSGTLRIPASAPAGAHTLVALGAGASIQASVALQVTAAATTPGDPATTGSATTPGRLAATVRTSRPRL